MKCPKCGYNSFEYNDSCSKCSNDLAGYKQTYGLTSLILPPQVRSGMAESLKARLFTDEPAPETTEAAHDIFSFDLPDDELAAAAGGGTAFNDDPFNFDDSPAPAPAPQFGEFSFDDEASKPAAAGDDDAFASLLEQTPAGGPAPAPASPAPGNSPGEFDLENFSWDDTPAATAGPGATEDDTFDSLFGDDNTTK